ncbi:hypothetical protein A2707_05520 [Candidatus Saccharibacteria bacterium RIFCSPHIGHO2_01_FULL_45_15]|nr:MAG: hypothetical protein A2707_05520 [Candidatus Saccharibacteria bacterium RIFCSPHIGHO2_01_FULL_45_15]OGL28905.1 MAG: hypothetical protein A3C39_05735 [Candidatus Saccharibacteria bacterium RIFCSPHIGHO2_02_FULL_46_12]OGL31918.1 MAG: hypothetical protein A3E76_01465 [Candidatus Saccharibacteria bacterium RIFCSPHIGHO2_12_FULL_44_22]
MRRYLSSHVWWQVGIVYIGIVFAVLLTYLFGGSGHLSGELPTAHAVQPATTTTESVDELVRITVPSVDIDLPIIRGEYDSQSGWTVEKLAANYIPSSHGINRPGTTVIYGHDTSEVFRRIKAMEYGAEVEVTTKKGATYHYIRDSSDAMIIQPDDVSILSETSSKHKIYLLTCDGWQSDKRYVLSLSLREEK